MSIPQRLPSESESNPRYPIAESRIGMTMKASETPRGEAKFSSAGVHGSASLRALATWLGKTNSDLHSLATLAYRQGLSIPGRFVQRLRHGSLRLQKEHPVKFLAYIAGSAFVIGFATRIWRSKCHGR